jgi:hypothetical protein
MQDPYQSEEPDDTSSYDATNRSIATEQEDEEGSEEEESRYQTTDADVDRQPETEAGNQWWQNLGPRTRRKARVNYTEEKIIPAQPTSEVCSIARFSQVVLRDSNRGAKLPKIVHSRLACCTC